MVSNGSMICATTPRTRPRLYHRCARETTVTCCSCKTLPTICIILPRQARDKHEDGFIGKRRKRPVMHKTKQNKTKQNKTCQQIERFKSSPAVLSWYISDEPDGAGDHPGPPVGVSPAKVCLNRTVSNRFFSFLSSTESI